MTTLSPTGTIRRPSLRFWQRLRWSLVAYFVLLALIPLGIVVYFTLTQVSSQASRQVLASLESISVLKTSQIQQWLHSAQEIATAVVNSDSRGVFVDALNNPTEAKQASVSQTLKTLVEVNDNAQDVVKIFERYFLYTPDGRVIAASNLSDLGKSVQRQPYYDGSLKGNYTQPPYYAVGTGQLTMVQTVPVLDNGKVVGVLAGQLNVATLSKIMLERVGFGETGETYLISIENNYFLTPSHFEGYNQPRAWHSQGIDQVLLKKNSSGVYPDYRNISVFGVYRWIPELQAGLIAEQDVSEALGTTTTLVNFVILIAIISAIAAVIIGLNRITRITRPLGALTQAAQQITAGDLTVHANVKERNEIGLLADAFNGMTTQLSQNIKTLDHQIVEIERTNKELQIATAQARESTRLKSEFLSTMSHELRTPLNAMLGFTGILLAGMDGVIDDTARYMIERVEANAKRLLGLINDVLDISKIEAGRMELIEAPVTLSQLVNQWQQQTAVLAEQKGLQFTAELDPMLPKTIILDRERVTQVVTNLLSNAFKFTEKGSVRLRVFQADNQLMFTVSDTGIGIPPHALNYIFDEFRQVDGSWRRNYGGSGLGLAIVRNLCRIMQGKISVESKLGEGSTFIVQLPLRPVAEAVPVVASR